MIMIGSTTKIVPPGMFEKNRALNKIRMLVQDWLAGFADINGDRHVGNNGFRLNHLAGVRLTIS